MNFLMLFANTMVTSSTNGEFSKEVLHHVPIDADMSTLDWCGYLLKYLKVSKKHWDRNHPEKNLYAGPATFLALLYVDRTKCVSLDVVRERPIFKNWYGYLSTRENKEIAAGSFGLCELWDNKEKFGSKEDCYKYLDMKIEEALSLKKLLFETFKEQMQRYPDDPTLSDYYKKTCNIYSSEESLDKDVVNEVIGNVLSSINEEVSVDKDDDDEDQVDLNLDSQKIVLYSPAAQVNLGSDEFYPVCTEVDNPQEDAGGDALVESDKSIQHMISESEVDVVLNKVVSETDVDNLDTPTPPNKPEALVVCETNEKNEDIVEQVSMDVVNDDSFNDDVMDDAAEINDKDDNIVNQVSFDVDKDCKGNDNLNDFVIEENSVVEKDYVVEKDSDFEQHSVVEKDTVVEKDFVVEKDSVVEKKNDVEFEKAVVANVVKEQKNVDSVNEVCGFEKDKECHQNQSTEKIGVDNLVENQNVGVKGTEFENQGVDEPVLSDQQEIESLTQWDLDVDSLIRHCDLAILNYKKKESAAAYKKKRDAVISNDDIPSFDLGITQTPTPQSYPEQAVVSQDIVEFDPVISKRPIKPSAVLRSPYINKTSVVSKRLSGYEFAVSNYLFSCIGNKNDFVFHSTNPEFLVSRLTLETLCPNIFIETGVISVWSMLLNSDELSRKAHSVRRLFLPTDILHSDIYDDEKKGVYLNQKMQQHFNEGFDLLLNNFAVKLQEIDLIFMPICKSDHFYVLVFDLRKKGSFIILDNLYAGSNFKSKYSRICTFARLLVSKALSRYNHPASEIVLKSKPCQFKLHWQTLYNFSDCGVFIMRHMETYMGEEEGKYDCEIPKESTEQKVKLRRLRFRYAARILTHPMNLQGQLNMQTALEFVKDYDKDEIRHLVCLGLKNREIRENEADEP